MATAILLGLVLGFILMRVLKSEVKEASERKAKKQPEEKERAVEVQRSNVSEDSNSLDPEDQILLLTSLLKSNHIGGDEYNYYKNRSLSMAQIERLKGFASVVRYEGDVDDLQKFFGLRFQNPIGRFKGKVLYSRICLNETEYNYKSIYAISDMIAFDTPSRLILCNGVIYAC